MNIILKPTQVEEFIKMIYKIELFTENKSIMIYFQKTSMD